MQPENLVVAHQQAGAFDRGDDLGDGGDITARKYVPGDPGAGHVGAGRAADRMQDHHAVIAEKLGASPKKPLVETNADMLEHADRHDPVEPARNIAIVAEEKSRRSRQVLLRRAGVRGLPLFGRERDAGNVGACHLGEIEAKAAPARAYVEHAVVVSDQQLGGEVALLGELGIVERGVRRVEIGAAILPVGVEKEGIEPPVQIIVMSDIVSRAAAPIELPDAPAEIAQPPLQPGPARQHVGLIEQDFERIRDRAVLDHKRAVHKGFAERQFRIEQDPALGPFAQEPYRHRWAGAVAAGKTVPARGREGHRAAADELTQEITQQTIHRSTNGATCH